MLDGRWGWRKDTPDARDRRYAAAPLHLDSLPAKVDLRPQCPPVYDQGRIGSCTANALAFAVQFARRKAEHQPDFVPSRLFIYYNERNIEGTIGEDAGAMLRDGCKVIASRGVCPEDVWPYDPTEADRSGRWGSGARAIAEPPAEAWRASVVFQAFNYYAIQQTLPELKACLADGFPFAFGFTVFDSLYDGYGNPVTHVPLPTSESTVLGGHAVAAVGYDDTLASFVVRNSWGAGVQDEGYFYLPYLYVIRPDIAADCWTIRLTTN